MADDIDPVFVRALARCAIAAAVKANSGTPAADPPKTATDVLLSLMTGHFQGALTDGAVLISNSEAGGSTLLQIPMGLTPDKIMKACEQAISFVGTLANPMDVNFKTRDIWRLKVSFKDKNFAIN
jgi:hypothetical protein